MNMKKHLGAALCADPQVPSHLIRLRADHRVHAGILGIREVK